MSTDPEHRKAIRKDYLIRNRDQINERKRAYYHTHHLLGRSFQPSLIMCDVCCREMGSNNYRRHLNGSVHKRNYQDLISLV